MTRSSTPLIAGSIAALLLLTACGGGGGESETAQQTPAAAPSEPAAGGTPEPEQGAEEGSAEVDIDSADSATVVVNKQRPLSPESYAPSPLSEVEGAQLRDDAAQAVGQMLSDMRAEGITVSITSAYRPYDEQVTTYQHWVDVNGQETADTVSARPGHSEHQTGLAVDLADGSGCDLQECFADTEAAQWAAEHAHEYGLVLRFPSGGQDVTGYAYEPWHYRYLGQEEAARFHDAGAETLEEFYGTGPAPDYS